MAGEMLVGESPNDEENGEAHETHELNWLTSNNIDGGNGHPVARNCASNNKDTITSGKVVEDSVNVWSSAVANGGKHSGRVETETIELKVCCQYRIGSFSKRRSTHSNVKQEPRTRCSEQDFSVFPLAIEAEEIFPAGLGDFHGLRLGFGLGNGKLTGFST